MDRRRSSRRQARRLSAAPVQTGRTNRSQPRARDRLRTFDGAQVLERVLAAGRHPYGQSTPYLRYVGSVLPGLVAKLRGAVNAVTSKLRKDPPSPMAAPPTRIQQPLDESFVLEKCDYFVDVTLWPRGNEMAPREWLSNFTHDEKPYAVHLLNSFLYFSRGLTDALLVGAVNDLSRHVVDLNASYDRCTAQWNDFLDSVVVTYPTGEEPSVTDSGYAFARKARQVLGIPEGRILSPEETLEHIASTGIRPVLFLDDFVGTGSQFLTTWNRRYATSAGDTSFSTAFGGAADSAFYAPLIAAADGVRAIARKAPTVRLAPAHVLPDFYSALHPDSIVWPETLHADAFSVLQEVSRRAGIPDSGGMATDDWQGFRRLGLCLAFEHGVPDATLPLFYWEENDWHPLIRRT
jgi:hypothetical protein